MCYLQFKKENGMTKQQINAIVGGYKAPAYQRNTCSETKLMHTIGNAHCWT